MKQKIKLILVILAGTLFNSCYSQIANFQGTWKTSDSYEDEFVLKLTQNDSILTGSHISVQLNGDRIDSPLEDTDISINGNVISSTEVNVTFKSAFSNVVGTAKITKINSTEILWKIITPPSGEYYFPLEVKLYKQ